MQKKDELAKKIEEITSDISFLDRRLSKPGYKDKAPKHLVEKDQEKLKNAKESLLEYQNQLNQLETNSSS